MNRALVIKYGDPKIADAIEDGMKLTQEQVETVQAEIDRQHIMRSLVRVAVGNDTTPDEYRAMMAREQYRMQRYERPTSIARKVADGLLVAWAMVWLAVYGIGEYLSEYREE